MITLDSIIEASKGHFITVKFVKKDGSVRTMNCRTGVINSAEFADRFFSIFATVDEQTADELFVQMALLLPQPKPLLRKPKPNLALIGQ